MDNELTQVVDVVANKIGIAADRLAPVGQTLVAETAHRSLLYALGAFALCGILSVVVRKAFAKAHTLSNSNDADCYYMTGLVVILVTAIGVVFGFSFLGEYASPTLTLLENLKK